MVCKLLGSIDPSKRLQYVRKTSKSAVTQIKCAIGGELHIQKESESCHETSLQNVDITTQNADVCVPCMYHQHE